jgi:hypothetical protein
MPDQARHDAQKINGFLNYDTASQGRGDQVMDIFPVQALLEAKFEPSSILQRFAWNATRFTRKE